MKKNISFIFLSMLISYTLSQNCLIGVWSNKFDYYGIKHVNEEDIYKGNLLLKGDVNDWYILVADDSLSINNVRQKMEELKKRDYFDLWVHWPNSFYNYLINKPNKEFLPDGRWFNYTTDKGETGVILERFIKNGLLYNKFIKYDPKDRNIICYFELKDNKLDGIVYFIDNIEDNNVLKIIDLYWKGEKIKTLYERNKYNNHHYKIIDIIK